jgi:hypothetical protein
MQRLTCWAGAAALVLTLPAVAGAAPIVLTFEGVGNQADILGFYSGGTDSVGNHGPDYGVDFVRGALAIIDADEGGSGNIANEPSGKTALFFLDVDAAIMTVPAGFDTGFSFYFSGNPALGNGSVTVYSGVDGTGDVLATGTLNTSLTPLGGCGGGDPTGQYSCWSIVGISFDGIAKSVAFGGAANFIAFDDVTFGSITPGGEGGGGGEGEGGGGGEGAVPEPASVLLLGLGAVGALSRRARRREGSPGR